MEALVTYHAYLEEAAQDFKKASKIAKENGTPSNKKNEITVAHLPVVNELASKLKEKKANSLQNVRIIFVLHFLNDLPPFLDKFHFMGCEYSDMYLLAKTYAYPQRRELSAYFEKMGCNVYIPEDPKQETFGKLTEVILHECLEKTKKERKKILIIEDGGYFAPLFHSKAFASALKSCRGAVEQTTKGYRRDMKITELEFPIITISNSKIKQYLETPEVAETLAENIIQVTKDEKPVNYLNTLIIGFGKIGESLADVLEKRRVDVSVYDVSPERRMHARESAHAYRKQVLETLDDLKQFDVIVGTSGETSLNRGEDFWTLKHNVILASGSSERIEFNLTGLEEQSENVRRQGLFTEYTLKGTQKLVRVLCDGEPINFPLSGGISKAVIDPVYAEMFWAAVEVSTNEKLKNKIYRVKPKIEEEIYRLYRKRHKS